MAAFRGMHVSSANSNMRNYQESVTTRQTDRQSDGQRRDKVIPMCRYALQETQKHDMLMNSQYCINTKDDYGQ